MKYKALSKGWTRGLAGAALLAPPLLLGLGLWVGSEAFMRAVPVDRPFALKVLGHSADTVTLTRTLLSARTGEFRLEWTQGYGLIGGILELTEKTVTRRFKPVLGKLKRGLAVRVRPYALEDNPLRTCGLSYQTVQFSSELGELPAWFVPATHTPGIAPPGTWAILIHGRSGGPQEFVHALPTLHKAGLPALAPSYRNHGTAPRSPDGLHHHGHYEWKDVEAAFEYALQHGAKDFVLYGVSMGGGMCLTTLRRSPYAPLIRALVLDCPALDWNAVLEMHADSYKFSKRAARAVAKVSEWRSGWALREINHTVSPAPLGVPTLLVHGDIDTVVPVSSSDKFAELHSGEVTYLRVHNADHIQAWNVDREAFREGLEDLLERVMG